MKAQRIRFRYRIGPDAAEFRHRDLVSAWQEAAKRAGLPLTYSEGKKPAPQISPAAPLPHRVTSDGELIDIHFSERVDPASAQVALARHLPPGIEPVSAEEMGVGGPSLQSQLRWADYEAWVPAEGLDAGDVRRRITELLAADTIPAEYRRENKVRLYDLRPLVLDLALEGEAEGCLVLTMRLRAEPERTGRADQVVLALGLPEAVRIHRRRLYADEAPAAVTAYRRLGEPEEG